MIYHISRAGTRKQPSNSGEAMGRCRILTSTMLNIMVMSGGGRHAGTEHGSRSINPHARKPRSVPAISPMEIAYRIPWSRESLTKSRESWWEVGRLGTKPIHSSPPAASNSHLVRHSEPWHFLDDWPPIPLHSLGRRLMRSSGSPIHPPRIAQLWRNFALLRLTPGQLKITSCRPDWRLRHRSCSRIGNCP